MKIRSQFILFAISVVILLATFFGALFQYRASVNDAEEALQQQYDSYLLANGLRQGSQDLTRLVRTYVATGNTFYKDEYFRILDIRGGKAPTPVDYYKRIYWSFLEAGEPAPFPDGDTVSLHDRMARVGITDDEFKLLDEAVANSDGLVKLETQAMDLVEKTPSSIENTLAATALVNSPDYHKFVADIMRPVDKFYVKMGNRIQGRIDASATAISVAFYLMLGSATTLALLLAAFGTLVNKQVLGGIARLRDDMINVAQGNLAIPLQGQDRQDEIGDMAKTLATFKAAAIERQKIEERAKSDREAYEKQQDAIHRTESEKAADLQKATTHIGEGLKRLASGDLSFQLVETFAADFEPLRHDFNSSVVQLANTLTSVAESVIAISTGSVEIASGATDLSKRTEQQAASLEQTAAALDEITVNVSSSSKRVEDARQVAAKANDSATRSGEVVAQAVSAMSRIESSSKQISNIIGVIDEIAFQTNLLALNAGVEAARAGDAGKGFAVVAQEVRELAQRSAGAAKEIKGLIQASSIEVSTGVKLVSDTGEVLKAIGEYIVDINEHMESIAVSPREQSTGLAEVNTAVNQMDQTTQQNAAMVEESSAASATLTNETNNLRNLIEHFTLAQPVDHVKSLRQTAQKMNTPSLGSGQSRYFSSKGSNTVTQEWAEF